LLCDSEIRRPQEKKNKSSKENSYVDRLWWPLRFFFCPSLIDSRLDFFIVMAK
jgi:hypothetical protein